MASEKYGTCNAKESVYNLRGKAWIIFYIPMVRFLLDYTVQV